jgi:hypothetical protein
MRNGFASIVVSISLLVIAGNAFGLGIQVAPQTLVVSSGGDNLTLHTSFRGYPPEDAPVVLEITPEGGTPKEVPIVHTHLDDRGYYVVRCNRLDAADAVGEFEGQRTTATVTLTIMGDSGSEVITVRK